MFSFNGHKILNLTCFLAFIQIDRCLESTKSLTENRSKVGVEHNLLKKYKKL